jgi:hypothetical protein
MDFFKKIDPATGSEITRIINTLTITINYEECSE